MGVGEERLWDRLVEGVVVEVVEGVVFARWVEGSVVGGVVGAGGGGEHERCACWKVLR